MRGVVNRGDVADGMPGAERYHSIGIMLVSGMVIGTLFTLFVVPSIYVLVARTRAAVAPAAVHVSAQEPAVPELAEAAV